MDIDIDTPPLFNPLAIFKDNAIKASLIKDKKIQPHPCGVYFQEIPIDPITKLSAIPYDEAEQLGYFKIDFLHLGIYSYFENKDEITALLKIDPEWDLLNSPTVVSKLFQLSKYYNVINKIKPKSISDIADTLALIRPGKSYVLNLYLRDKEKGKKELYKIDPNSSYSFKKSHAYAYALIIVLQLHLINAGIEF